MESRDDLTLEDIPELKKRLSVSAEKAAKLEKQVVELQKELNIVKVLNANPRDLPCFDPFRIEDGRIILSSVNHQTEEWYEHGLLTPHEPIRRDLIEVDYLLKYHVLPTEAWKLVNFFSWYEKRFVVIIHKHHDAEEQIFFPMIKKRCNIPDKTSADHKVLVKLLEDVSAIGKPFMASKNPEDNVEASAVAHAKLVVKWAEMKELMFPHLAEEEEQLKTFIREVFKEEDFDRMVNKIIKHEGISGGKRGLPSIDESIEMWGTAKNKEEFRKKVPFPIKFMLQNFWKKSYAKYHRGALNSLRAGAARQLIVE